MAIRISSDASAPKRSANAPTQTSYTLAGWFYFNSATPARFWGPLGIYAGTDGVPTTATDCHQISSSASGSAQLDLVFYTAGGVETHNALGTMRVSTWYFLALTCSALAAGGLKAYMREQFSPVIVSATNATTSRTFTPARFEFGRDAFASDVIDGAAQHCIAFDRVLDAAELTKLSYALLREKPLPDRRNLNVYYRLRGADDIQDLSGNARPMTVTIGANAQGLRVWPSKFRRRVPRAGGAHNIATGLAISANTAFAMGRLKRKTLGLSSSANTALLMTKAKRKTLGLSTGASSAFSMARKKTKLLGLPSSANTARPMVAPHSLSIGLATSANTALAMTRKKAKTLGLAVSTNVALALTHAKRKALGLASSANTALSIRPRRLKVVGLAVSANVALAMARLKRKVLGLGSSSNTALPMTHTGGAGGGSAGGGIASWINEWRRRIFFD